MVSAVMDYGRQNFPLQSWTPDLWAEFQALLRRVEALDAKMNQPDCHDPAKAKWMADVEARLAALENPKSKRLRKKE